MSEATRFTYGTALYPGYAQLFWDGSTLERNGDDRESTGEPP
jgi:hypothetical protein